MIKLLIGGSPCTFWSIAQSPEKRETTAEGLGWELFKNYLIAKEKFCPDFFLYENNKSAAQAIKDQIKSELKVFNPERDAVDTGGRYIEINSALVSAQNRQRFYVHNCGEVKQPADRGILLKHVLETRSDAIIFQFPHGFNRGGVHAEKSPTVLASGTWQYNNLCVEPICVQEQVHGRKAQSDGSYDRRYEARTDGKSGTLTGTNRQNAVAIPIENVGDAETIQKALPKLVEKYGYIPEMFNAYNIAEIDEKSPTLSTGSMVTSSCETTVFEKTELPIYEVKNGIITIKEKQYPIKLPDGFYLIRKLTVAECCRLQTLPDDYCRVAKKTQAYKGIGNGWTAEVIIHILQNALKDIPKDEKIVVLSMYDGIGTGRYCLDKMGFSNVEYYAYEIDKSAIEIAQSNYPDIIQLGDAFDLRKDDWQLPIENNKTRSQPMNNNDQKEQARAADALLRLEKHKGLCAYLSQTYERKNADYGNSFGDMFSELGIVSAITRIGDKYNRIKNIAVRPTICVKDETIIDTLLDLANYCIMTVIEIGNQNERKIGGGGS